MQLIIYGIHFLHVVKSLFTLLFYSMGGKKKTDKKREFMCNLCGSKYDKGGIVEHNKRVHRHLLNKGGKECPKCFGVFLSKAEFCEHENHVHKERGGSL